MLDLLNLHKPLISSAFMEEFSDRIRVRNSESAAMQPRIYIVHFNLDDERGGLQTYCAFDHKEIEKCLGSSREREITDLFKARAVAACESLVGIILTNAHTQLVWDRASRWQRLKWAWKGVIQPNA